MPGIKASANRASCQKYAVCGRDFNRGGIFETLIYKKRQDMSDNQYGTFRTARVGDALTGTARFPL
jgi:hypothetical protein